METRAIDFFGKPDFRKGQKEAIEKVEDAFNRGVRFVILESPTGTGKSQIAATFAKWFGNAHILTVQKILQDQYAKDFKDEMYVMKGRRAYTCIEKKESGERRTCADGLCKLYKAIKHGDCPYKLALKEAEDARITVHNFDSFYYQSNIGCYSDRKVLICDECHALENKFLNYTSFTVSNKRQPNLIIPNFDRVDDYDEFLTGVLVELKKQEDLLGELEELTNETFKELEEVKELILKINVYFKKKKTNEFIHEFINHEGMYQSVTFKPVFVDQFIVEHLFPYGQKVLLMSATVLDKKIFCKSVGIKESEAEFISIPSFFPVVHRPILMSFCGSMNYNNINVTLPLMVKALKLILEKNKGVKGIIHTVSERVANYIKEKLKDRRLTFNKDFPSVNDMLEVHAEKEGSVIVASGLKEGLDLFGDLSRLQIIVKVPYPSLGDKRVKRRLEIDKGWYGYQTALSFVQSIGRSVRSEDDTAVTYVLDADFQKFYNMNKQFIPGYIKESIMTPSRYEELQGLRKVEPVVIQPRKNVKRRKEQVLG
jgi:Rad3-related DNA helicase